MLRPPEVLTRIREKYRERMKEKKREKRRMSRPSGEGNCLKTLRLLRGPLSRYWYFVLLAVNMTEYVAVPDWPSTAWADRLGGGD